MTSILIPMILLVGTQEQSNLDIALHCIHMVESSGGKNTKDGDNGDAIGEYQIHKSYWEDATRILKVDWPYKNARNKIKAEKAVRAYLLHYQKTNKYPATIETYTRLHNGGPNGPKRKSTVVYWNKCKQYLPKKGK